MLRVAWIALVVLLGCSTENAAFDEPRSTSTDGTGPATSVALDSGADETMEPPSGGCKLHDDAPIRLEIREAGVTREPDCSTGGDTFMTEVSRIQYPPPDQFQLNACTDSTCGDCQGAEVTLDFRGSLENPPALPNCGRIVAWATVGRDGCRWQGVVMLEAGQLLPTFIASNVRAPPPLTPFSLGLAPAQPCDGDQCSGAGPGRHALVLLDQPFTVEDSPVTLDVDFAMGGVAVPFEFVNRMASVTETCQERVSWTARRLARP